jgi:hypothetical protein
MKTTKYIWAFIAVLALASCKKDQYYLYNDIARIQFGPEPSRIYTPSYNLVDTLKPYTFYYEDATVKEDTVFFDIYAIGGTAKNDRSFTLQQEQLPNTLNAVAGTHYVAFSDARVSKHYTIKAGTVHARVPVIVLRDPSLKTATPVLKFKVTDDTNFKIGEVSNIWRKVLITDRLSQPPAWTGFGTYSVVKHKFMIDVTGEKWDQDFFLFVRADFGLQGYYVAVVKTALIDYNLAHPGNPLKDENGELVVIP